METTITETSVLHVYHIEGKTGMDEMAGEKRWTRLTR